MREGGRGGEGEGERERGGGGEGGREHYDIADHEIVSALYPFPTKQRIFRKIN